MSAPTPIHEDRARALESLADLAGFTNELAWEASLLPDVLRFSSRHRALFVGDAKATETAGATATFDRLARYVGAAAPVLDTGSGLWMVVAHGRPNEADAWADTLRRALLGSRIPASRVAAQVLDADLAIAWAWVSTHAPCDAGPTSIMGSSVASI